MEVVKRGKLPGEIEWRGTCSRCKSVMKEKAANIKNAEAGDYRSEGPLAHAECPVCGGDFVLYPVSEM